MDDFDGNFMETVPYWCPPSSPTPRTILAMMNDQADNGLNPLNEIFSQTNLSIDQSEQRSDLGQRFPTRIGFDLPRFETDNMSSSFAPFLGSSSVLSPGFSPSTLLQSQQIVPPASSTNFGPLETVERASEGHATTMIPNNDLPHQPLHVDLPLQEGFNDIPTGESFYIPTHASPIDPTCGPLATPLMECERIDDDDILNLISLESEDENKEEEKEELHDIADELVGVKPSGPKRRKYEMGSSMIGATRLSKQQRVILHMESEEDHPDDGFRWRKYGQKIVKWNPNPRSYYKCTHYGCNVKKHVERGADNKKLVVTTYDGIHHHAPPSKRGHSTGPQNQPNSSVSHQDDRTVELSKPPSPETVMPFSSSYLEPQFDLTKLYMTGISKLPDLPVNQNLLNKNDEPMIDAIPDGTEVYNELMNQVFPNYGLNL